MTNSGVDEQLTAQIPPKQQDFRLSARNHGISCQERILHTGATSMISIACSEINETAQSLGFLGQAEPSGIQFCGTFRETLSPVASLKFWVDKVP